MKIKTVCCWLLFAPFVGNAQLVHEKSKVYVWPEDALVRQKLEMWRDLKFGMIIHWGLYAIPGIVESWTLCSEDEDWIPRDSTADYTAYKQWYWNLSKEFNPVKFNPEQWALAGKAAGMKYLVFTTKHHDGFCLFDSKETDFTIVRGPFANNPKADAAKYVFQAFREQNFMIGAYFSKPDWHSQDYWWPRYATPNRHNNYDVRKHPWKWEQFKQYTYNQLSELMYNYGAIDILWLDGSWVRPVPPEEQSSCRWPQDIDIPKIAAMARDAQPGLLIVDRMVYGPYENYQTPEQSIPAVQLDYPWETCMTLGRDWGYVPNQPFKSARQVIHALVEIVAKGGSLLLGVGPDAEGLLPEEVVERLKEIGKWMNKNGTAIYNTRTLAHYRDADIWFTRDKAGKKVYAIVCLPENTTMLTTVSWKGNKPAKGAAMRCLETGKSVKWKSTDNETTVFLPNNLSSELSALVLCFTIQ
ncbi:MAG: alpha-L-fucosidase [Prevotellaceae bacterium]|jgi:alpha-L-fucosidase|nr:alpha-L-fucosidase [Prevotellaceae bacterium]